MAQNSPKRLNAVSSGKSISYVMSVIFSDIHKKMEHLGKAVTNVKESITNNVNETIERTRFPPPLLGWYQSTNYLRAFIIASTISALVVPVSNQINDMMKNVRVPSAYRFMVGILVTFMSSMIVLVSMRRLFGTGGSMLANPDRTATFWYPSSAPS